MATLKEVFDEMDRKLKVCELASSLPNNKITFFPHTETIEIIYQKPKKRAIPIIEFLEGKKCEEQ
jgi:hypothetical protein